MVKFNHWSTNSRRENNPFYLNKLTSKQHTAVKHHTKNILQVVIAI